MRDNIRRLLDRSVVWNGFSVLCICMMLMILGLRMRQEYRQDQASETFRLAQVRAQATVASATAMEAAKVAAYNKGILDARTPLFAALTAELHRTRTEGTVTDARILEKLVQIERLLSAERARAASRSRASTR